MLRKLLVASVFGAVCVSSAAAQIKVSFAGQCAKPDIVNSIPIAGNPRHAYAISQAKCIFTRPNEADGAKTASAIGWTSDELRGDSDRFRGYFEETWSDGGRILYRYEGMGSFKDGAFQSADETWSVFRASGPRRGLRGRGTCKVKATADGGVSFECEGELQRSARAPRKPKAAPPAAQ